jgi:adenylate kinase
MHIVLLGPPGSNTNALSQKIIKTYGLSLISQNNVLETAAAGTGELSQIAKEARETTRVSDELLFMALRNQWPPDNIEAGCLFIDIPKNEHQIEMLDSMLAEDNRAIDLVLNLQVDNDDLVERLVGHIHCDHCGADYNLYVNPPVVDRVCDNCGGRVKQRPADYEETISNRLRLYGIRMAPVLGFYKQQGILQTLSDDGENLKSLWQTSKKHLKRIATTLDAETNELQSAIDNAAAATKRSHLKHTAISK